jgi:hypothetical protein
MKPSAMLAELEAAAAALQVKVSYEVLGASVGLGGLCKVKGQIRIIIDKRASTNERIAALGKALSQVPEVLENDNVELKPKVREVVAYYRGLHRAA